MPYILALDQGTTSSRAILFDHEGAIKSAAQAGVMIRNTIATNSAFAAVLLTPGGSASPASQIHPALCHRNNHAAV